MRSRSPGSMQQARGAAFAKRIASSKAKVKTTRKRGRFSSSRRPTNCLVIPSSWIDAGTSLAVQNGAVRASLSGRGFRIKGAGMPVLPRLATVRNARPSMLAQWDHRVGRIRGGKASFVARWIAEWAQFQFIQSPDDPTRIASLTSAKRSFAPRSFRSSRSSSFVLTTPGSMTGNYPAVSPRRPPTSKRSRSRCSIAAVLVGTRPYREGIGDDGEGPRARAAALRSGRFGYDTWSSARRESACGSRHDCCSVCSA